MSTHMDGWPCFYRIMASPFLGPPRVPGGNATDCMGFPTSSEEQVARGGGVDGLVHWAWSSSAGVDADFVSAWGWAERGKRTCLQAREGTKQNTQGEQSYLTHRLPVSRSLRLRLTPFPSSRRNDGITWYPVSAPPTTTETTVRWARGRGVQELWL